MREQLDQIYASVEQQDAASLARQVERSYRLKEEAEKAHQHALGATQSFVYFVLSRCERPAEHICLPASGNSRISFSRVTCPLVLELEDLKFMNGLRIFRPRLYPLYCEE
jgi:hypothetical protein